MYKNKHLIVLALFFIIGLVVYWNCLDNPFQYDDDMVIVKNLNIRELKNIPSFFDNPAMMAYNPAFSGHYRPLIVTSYAINYATSGLNPVGYHLMNIALHTGSAFLIFLIVKAMLENSEQLAVSSKQATQQSAYGSLFTANYMAPLAAGLIFLVHPFNSEAVNYVTARSSLMSGFFYLMGFWCWVKYRSEKQEVRSQKLEGFSYFLLLTSKFYLFSFFAFIAGMLCKEVVVTLPIMFWLYDLYFYDNPQYTPTLTLPRQGGGKKVEVSLPHKEGGKKGGGIFSWRNYLVYLPFVFAAIIPYFLIRMLTMNKVLGKFQRDMVTQFLTEVPVLVKHWQMFIVPRGLNLMHDAVINHSMTLSVMVSIIFLLIYIVIAVYLFFSRDKKLRVISLLMFWFFIVLLPTTIIPLNAIFQENRGYLAVVTFAAVGGVLIGWAYNKLSRKLVAAGLVLLLAVYSVIIVQRNMVWDDSVRLLKDTIEKSPRYGLAYAALADAYRERGDMFLSIEAAKRGLAVDPDNYYIRINLARSYHLTGNIDDAIKEYELALDFNPSDGVIWNELGALYVKKGDIEKSELLMRKAVIMWPKLSPLHYNLGVVLAGRGKLTEAEAEFKQAIALYPDYFPARFELAELYERIGRKSDAEEQYREIIRIKSERTESNPLLFGQHEDKIELMVKQAEQRLENRK